MIIKGESIKPVDFEGLEILDYTAGQSTSSSLAVITVSPGGKHCKAWSKRSDKYYYILSGSILFVLDGIEYELNSGNCCIVLQGKHFSYRNVTQQPTKLLLCHTPSFDIESEVFGQ